MTKKDFELIARVLHDNLKGEGFSSEGVTEEQRKAAVHCLALDFSLEFQRVNPRFDTSRFIKACTGIK